MFPVLFSIGGWSISSFGLFLVLGLFLGGYFIWKLSLLHELEQERTFDLLFLSLSVGLLLSRIYFILSHPGFFIGPDGVNVSLSDKLLRAVLFIRYSGLSFWGAFIGGLFALWYFSKRMKLRFWQMADIAMVGLLLGISSSSIGCFFGSCEVGLPSTSFLAVRMAGLTDKRLPIQLLEAAISFLVFLHLYKKSKRFHFEGIVFSLGIIYIGIFKFLLEFLRGDRSHPLHLDFLGFAYSLAMIIAGIICFYASSKRSYVRDLKSFFQIIINSRRRAILLSKLKTTCYNQLVSGRLFFQTGKKDLFKRLNIRSTPKEL